jgi:hypothetical protein
MATFVTGQVLTAAQMNSIANLTVRNVTTTSDTFVLSDADNKLITYANTGTTTITIPPESSVAFTTGTVINIIKIGSSGTCTVTQGSGVTIASSGATSTSPSITKAFGAASCIKVGSNSWYVVGRLAE